MKLPPALRTELEAAMAAAGIPLPEGDARWADAERALVGVWASKFNDRAFFSMRKVGLDFLALRMAVLVQRVVPAQYAFVIHTTNPATGARLGGAASSPARAGPLRLSSPPPRPLDSDPGVDLLGACSLARSGQFPLTDNGRTQ